jgi:hypothetical protein
LSDQFEPVFHFDLIHSDRRKLFVDGSLHQISVTHAKWKTGSNPAESQQSSLSRQQFRCRSFRNAACGCARAARRLCDCTRKSRRTLLPLIVNLRAVPLVIFAIPLYMMFQWLSLLDTRLASA